MRSTNRWKVVLVAAAGITGFIGPAPRQAEAVSYTVVDLNPPGATVPYFRAYGVSGGQQVGSGYLGGGGLLWSGSGASCVDLTPTWADASGLKGVADGRQVGSIFNVSGTVVTSEHAAVWASTPASCVDLNPSGFTTSHGRGIGGGQQVGWGSGPATGDSDHALLWTGSAASYVDLNPAGFARSEAWGVSGGQQVGYGYPAGSSHVRALLWTGSAGSCVDLNPAGFTDSGALGVSGGQQVGFGLGSATGTYEHAMLWTGSADSYVDLNPVGWRKSVAWGAAGGRQVGYGFTPDGLHHALVWAGSADSYVDLNAFLPAGWGVAGTGDTQALGIDAAGNIVGYSTDVQGGYHAIMWVPVPEPVTAMTLAIGCIALVRRRIM